MNLYLISADTKNLDSYDSAVVASESYGKAMLIHPRGGSIKQHADENSWPARVQQINCTCIGTTNYYKEGDVICASFNAG